MFTARYGLIPYIKQTRLVFKRLRTVSFRLLRDQVKNFNSIVSTVWKDCYGIGEWGGGGRGRGNRSVEWDGLSATVKCQKLVIFHDTGQYIFVLILKTKYCVLTCKRTNVEHFRRMDESGYIRIKYNKKWPNREGIWYGGLVAELERIKEKLINK